MDYPNNGISVLAHHHTPSSGSSGSGTRAAATPGAQSVPKGTSSGQGEMKFQVLYTADHLPEAARKVLVDAHGGFAVDHRPGRGETYFALPGAGILKISADLKKIRLLNTPEEVKNANLHSTAIWSGSDEEAFLVFAANKAGKIFTTTLEGKLLGTLDAPTADHDFDHPEVKDYFLGQGNFAPTGADHLDGLYYVTTGYSNLDYVLTAKVLRTNPFEAEWSDLAFGGKGDAPGQFGTGHAITVPPGKKRLDIADRPHSRIERFSKYGHFRSLLKLPSGSLPCDIDYLEGYAVVACLEGPDKSKGAPIYILENDKLVSAVMPKEELGLANFVHNHNAVLHKIDGKFYIIAQAWNPGDFAILEQVVG
jgi:hypothetical protein